MSYLSRETFNLEKHLYINQSNDMFFVDNDNFDAIRDRTKIGVKIIYNQNEQRAKVRYTESL